MGRETSPIDGLRYTPAAPAWGPHTQVQPWVGKPCHNPSTYVREKNDSPHLQSSPSSSFLFHFSPYYLVNGYKKATSLCYQPIQAEMLEGFLLVDAYQSPCDTF